MFKPMKISLELALAAVPPVANIMYYRNKSHDETDRTIWKQLMEFLNLANKR